MPTSYTSSLRLALPATGENSGTWGSLVNTSITQLVEDAVSGYASVTMTDADYTLTTVNGGSDQARNMFVNMVGTTTQARNVICPTAEKLYFFKNSTTGGFALTLKTSAGTGISVPNGATAVLMCDGTNVITGLTYMSSITLGSALGAASGGTGLTSYTAGDLIYATASTTLAKLAVGTANYVLTTDGSAPTWTANTGTGNVVRATSPTLTTPILGTPTSGTLTNCTGLPISTGVSGLGSNIATFLATPSSANLAAAVTDETGSGALVFATSPTFTTPLLGTPTSGTLTNCTGLPVSSGISGLGTGVATFLATPSSANLAAAVTDETGSGALVFATSPTFTTPLLGTPTSGTLTNCTGLPVSSGISGLGSGVATFLATPSSANLAAAVTGETGSGALVFATSPTLVTPLLGTPTSGTLTNCTGLPVDTGISGLGAGVATFLATPTSANLAAAVTNETGTGTLVFSASPTFTGTVGGAAATFTGAVAVGALTVNGNQTNNATTGTFALRNNSTTHLEFHVRPSSGKAGYITITEDSVADRWAIGTEAASGTLNFRAGGLAATAVATLTSAGVFAVSGGVTAASFGNITVGATGAKGWWIDNNGGAGGEIRLRALGADATTMGSIGFQVSESDNGGAVQILGITSAGIAVTGAATATGDVTSSGGLVGYATGAGGTVTQSTDKSTAVTINKSCGKITMNNASLAANTAVAFTVNNSLVGANDVPVLALADGFAGTLAYTLTVEDVAAGTFKIQVRNNSAGALGEALRINFAVIKGVTS